MARSRQERKQEQEKRNREGRLRADRWGLKRLRKFWNDHIRAKKEVAADEQTLARFEAQKRTELANAKIRLRERLKTKDLDSKGLKIDQEFRRYKKYLKKCQRRVKAIERSKSGSVKLDFHKSEVKRMKELLFGDLQRIAS